MKAFAKSAVISGAGALLLGASVGLSNATIVSSATRVHPASTNSPLPPSSIKCSKGASSYCFTVQNTSTGSAIEATAKSGYGLLAASTSGTAVDGSTSSSAAYAVAGDNGGSGGIAVYGFAPSGYGVYGQSESSYGVYGITGAASGIGSYGQNTAANGVGVEGVGGSSQSGSASPAGVLGTDSAEFGYGIDGKASGEFGYGVYGDASGEDGGAVVGYSTGASGVGGLFQAAGNGGQGLLAIGPNSSGNPIFSEAGGGGPAFYTDDKGDGTFDGSVTASSFDTAIRRRDGVRVSASVPLWPRATIEDAGTARMTDGVGIVRFLSDFAATLDVSQGYQVFLTPDGDTRGLFVAQKYENGFIVRETQRGRSTLYFDYRVVAHPAGSSDERLPIYNGRRPHPRLRHLPIGSQN
jgi:hypothetical protein